MNGYDKLIETALAEVGYMEKASNAQLESKTANAGSGNYTKYWRDLKPSFQAQAWCDAFVDWCFMQAYGADMAQKLECGGYKEFYTPTSAQKYIEKGRYSKDPKIGDQVFFKNSQRIHHTGIVYDVDGAYVYTIEGNTSSGSEVIPNGGAVCKKKYLRANSSIAGYGHPDWALIKEGYPIGWNKNMDTGQWWYQYGPEEREFYNDRIVRISGDYYAFDKDGYMVEGEARIVTDSNGVIISVIK